MTTKLYTVKIKGKSNDYYFHVWLGPEFLDEYREDGIELDEVINTVPAWLPAVLVKPWVAAQDIFNFRFF